MGDRFYKSVVLACRPAFWVCSQPTVLHADRIPKTGPFILASNHLSPFDVPVLIGHAGRTLDFVSITEVFRNPLVAWLYGNMGAFPLDRSRSDPKTVRTILDRLNRGRVVAMFPEGRIRKLEDSAVHDAPFRPGVARLARLANVPIVPAVTCNTIAFSKVSAWLPLRHTRYGVAFGYPIPTTDETAAETALAQAFRTLYTELAATMNPVTKDQ